MKNIFLRMQKNQKGFTLVEMMVVIIIIGILVAIAVPVYSSTQKKAKETACNVNIRMIKSAIQQAQLEGETITPGNLNKTENANNTGIEKYFESIPKCPFGDGYVYVIGKDTNGEYIVTHNHETAMTGSTED